MVVVILAVFFMDILNSDIPTRSGSQFAQSAHERIMSRNPTARTNERRITAAGIRTSGLRIEARATTLLSTSLLLSPAAIVTNEKRGTRDWDYGRVGGTGNDWRNTATRCA